MDDPVLYGGLRFPKPRKRIVERGVGAEVVRAEAACRVCGARTLALDAHHVVPRSQGGDDVPANFAPLCVWEPSCHRLVTENDPAALSALRASFGPETLAYVLERKGEAWLDRRYPENPAPSGIRDSTPRPE